ncbi:threonine synthase, partial [Streptococcus anginosus]|nr:threonine synthase [Streptococcus anginosus]
VPQVVYYFTAYAQLLFTQEINFGDEVDFIVPTGNFGDILAGYYAKQLGLPVGKLVVASDKNNVLYDFLTTGVYDRNRD